MHPSNGIDYKIRLGNTLLDSNHAVQYQTLRYDFKPQSISDYSRYGKADVQEPINHDNGPPIDISFQPLPQHNLPQSFFKGNCERKTDDLSYDCILIWDDTRQEFVLEKLQTTIFVTKTDGSKLTKTPITSVNSVSDKKRKPVVEEIGNGVSYPQQEPPQQKRTKIETIVPTSTSAPQSSLSTMAPQSMTTFSSMPKSLSSMNGQTYIEEEDDDDASESESDEEDD